MCSTYVYVCDSWMGPGDVLVGAKEWRHLAGFRHRLRFSPSLSYCFWPYLFTTPVCLYCFVLFLVIFPETLPPLRLRVCLHDLWSHIYSADNWMIFLRTSTYTYQLPNAFLALGPKRMRFDRWHIAHPLVGGGRPLICVTFWSDIVCIAALLTVASLRLYLFSKVQICQMIYGTAMLVYAMYLFEYIYSYHLHRIVEKMKYVFNLVRVFFFFVFLPPKAVRMLFAFY